MPAKYFLRIKGENVLKLKTIEVCLGSTYHVHCTIKGQWGQKNSEVELRLLQKLSSMISEL